MVLLASSLKKCRCGTDPFTDDDFLAGASDVFVTLVVLVVGLAVAVFLVAGAWEDFVAGFAGDLDLEGDFRIAVVFFAGLFLVTFEGVPAAFFAGAVALRGDALVVFSPFAETGFAAFFGAILVCNKTKEEYS